MRTVADESGDRYLLLQRSSEVWLVRDPDSGTEQYHPADELTILEGESPLETAARTLPEAIDDELAVPGERARGLLAEIYAREPVGVRDLLGSYDLCESDLHGLLGEFTAAGRIQETTVAGERGYETTDGTRAVFADGE